MVKTIMLSLNSVASWSLKIFMVLATTYFLLEQNYIFAIFAFGSLVVSLLPAIINHSYDTNLPWGIDFWLTLWMALSILGSVGFYERFEWWDDMLHFGGTATLAYLAFVLIYALSFTGKLRLTIPFIGFFTFMISVAFGAMWEVLEFWIWQLTGIDTLAIGGDPALSLFDTFSDLQLDLVGAGLAAVLGMSYVARQRHVHLREWMHPFVKIFGRKIQLVRVVAREKKEELKAKVRLEKIRLRRKLKMRINR